MTLAPCLIHGKCGNGFSVDGGSITARGLWEDISSAKTSNMSPEICSWMVYVSSSSLMGTEIIFAGRYDKPLSCVT